MKKIFSVLCLSLLVGCAEPVLTMNEKEVFQSLSSTRNTNNLSFEFPNIQWAAFDTQQTSVNKKRKSTYQQISRDRYHSKFRRVLNHQKIM